jgi:hypothetical protein
MAWAVIGGSAAGLLRMPQDSVLLVAPIVLGLLAGYERFRAREPAATETRGGA